MPSFCGVVNCSNRSNRDKKSFYRLPNIPQRCKENRRKLIAERRKAWLIALRRADITEDKTRHLRICEDHFISGKPANITDLENPDWIPSLKMGYEKNSNTAYPLITFTSEGKVVNYLEGKRSNIWRKRLMMDDEININPSEITCYQNKTMTSTVASIRKLRSILWPQIFPVQNICNKDTSVGLQGTTPRTNKVTNKNNFKNEDTNVDLITHQYLSSMTENFTFEFLLKNISLIRKPNNFWGISHHSNIIICARWNEDDYSCEKRIVVENSLILRAFLKKWEVNLSELMKITCIDDISNLLEKVESY